MTGENTIDSIIFGNNLLTQHPGIFILTLLVNSNRTVGNEIVTGIYYSPMRVEAVARVIYMVSDNIKSRTNRYRDIGSFCKKLEEKLQQLPASVLVLFGKVAVLPLWKKDSHQ